MVKSTVSGQFLAALGLERQMEKAAMAHLQHIYRKILVEYGREARFERARLLRTAPLDYQQVRALDRTLDEISARLREIELEQALRN